MRTGGLRQKQMEALLSQVAPHQQPKLSLEEYTLDSRSAARLVHIASQIHEDVEGKTVLDLGCGTGILTIGAALAGANRVVGVDIDGQAIATAEKNANALGVDVEFVVGDIDCVDGGFDAVLMNPPFGSWRRGADIRFLEKAMDVGNVVYSLHKWSPLSREFLKRRIESMGWTIDRIYGMDVVIPRTFSFHRKRRYHVRADLYRIRR